MSDVDQELEMIRQYVLDPDAQGEHLLEMAERMAEDEARPGSVSPYATEEHKAACLTAAADTVAAFIHLAWGGAGRQEYAKRTYQMLCALRDRMRGMNPESTWQYAIDALNVDIQARLRRAERLVLDPEGESELIDHLFDGSEKYDYLHDVVDHVKQLHWQRRHSPEAAAECEGPATTIGPRGDETIETHLDRAATEAMATYVEQANIVRGMVENITDTGIVLRDRIGIQRELGAINPETWLQAGRQLADLIESRFGTRAGRREARLARGRWKSLTRRHAQASA